MPTIFTSHTVAWHGRVLHSPPIPSCWTFGLLVFSLILKCCHQDPVTPLISVSMTQTHAFSI